MKNATVAARYPDTQAVPQADTWPRVLELNQHRFDSRQKAMRYKHYGIWHSYSWQDYYRNVKCLAMGLLALGFQPGQKLLIIGDNAPEWYFGEMAAQCNRGIAVGLYSDLSAGEIKFIAQDCRAEFALVEDQEQADKLEQIRAELPDLKKVIYWRYKGLSKTPHDVYSGWRQVLNLGIQYAADHPGLFETNIAAGRADDICAIIYTSGTTGANPKGAVHTYGSLRTAGEYFMTADRLGAGDNLVS